MMRTEAGVSTTAPTGFRIAGLDGLRALAVLTVFVGHAGLHSYLPFLPGAGTGVTIFFFLSGYLITSLLRREFSQAGRVSIRDFYLRRVLRILPPLYIFVAASVLLTSAGAVAGRVTGFGLLAALLHFTNFTEIWGNPHLLLPGAGVLWSLSIEEHFYLVFPLVYAIMSRRLSRRNQAKLLLGLCILALVWRAVLVFGFGDGYNRTYFGTDTRADSLLGGCLLAVYLNPVFDELPPRLESWIAAPRRAVATLLGGFFLVVAGEQLSSRLAAVFEPTIQLIGLYVAFMVLLRAPETWVGRLLEWAPVVRLGVLSYTFYLFHGLILETIDQNTSLPVVPTAIVAFVVVLAICEAINRAVEQPLARLRRRLSHQRTRTVKPATPAAVRLNGVRPAVAATPALSVGAVSSHTGGGEHSEILLGSPAAEEVVDE